MTRKQSDGFISIVVVALLCFVLALVVAVLLGAELLQGRSRLDAAADLAALSAAGSSEGCFAAAEAAAGNGARLDLCERQGGTFFVVVSMAPPAPLRALLRNLGVPEPRLHSSARAGGSGQAVDHPVKQQFGAPLVERRVAIAALR